MESPCSTSRCSSQPRAMCKTGFKRERRWQNSATNELDKAKSALAISATTMTRRDGVLFRHLLQTLHPDVGEIAILARTGQAGGDALRDFRSNPAAA